MRVVIHIICALLLFLAFATPAMAQTGGTQKTQGASHSQKGSAPEAKPPQVVQKIEVKVISIYASKGPGGIDPSLASLRRQLERGFQDYTSFKKEGESSLNLELLQSGRTALANGGAVAITFLESEGSYVKLKFEIPGKVSTTLRVSRGSTFFQAGLPYKEGILVLAIEVQ